MGMNRSGEEYFKSSLSGKTIILIPDPKKKLSISSSDAYLNLDSLMIRKANAKTVRTPVYYIEQLIYTKEDTTITK
jgi:hypothetical protein